MALNWKLKNGAAKDLSGKVSYGECILPRDQQTLPSDATVRHEAMLINEVSLVLSEKRTSLSVMRTGLSILTLPVSVLSVLIVISRYYDPLKVMYLLGPLLGLCIILTALGSYMIIRALRRISHLDRVIVSLKKQNSNLKELCIAMDDLIAADDDND